jgi:hypothetical protein
VNIIWANMLMNVYCMMYGRVVAQVLLLRLIIESKGLLSFTIKESEIPHFHSVQMVLFDGVVNNADSCGVVNWDLVVVDDQVFQGQAG